MREKSQQESYALKSSFLEFLYPPKTIEFAKRLNTRRFRHNTTGRKRFFLTGKTREKSQSGTAPAREIQQPVDLDELDAIALKEVESEDTRPLWISEHLEITKQPERLDEDDRHRVKLQAKLNDDRYDVPLELHMAKRASNSVMFSKPTVRRRGSSNTSKKMDDCFGLSPSTAGDKAVNIYHAIRENSLDRKAVHGTGAIHTTAEATTDLEKSVLMAGVSQQASIEYWHSQSKQLGETFAEYIVLLNKTISIPQSGNDFAFAFDSEVPALARQLESTFDAGTKFLGRFMHHVEHVVFPLSRTDWTGKQWAFFIGMALQYPKRLAATRQRVGLIEGTPPAGQRGVFRLLLEAVANDKALISIRELLRLAIARRQIDFANSLLIFCRKQRISIDLVVSGLETLNSPLLVRWIAGLIERIEIPRWLKLQTKLQTVIQPDRQGYLDLIHLMMEFLLKQQLCIDVNAAMYEKAWTVFLRYRLLSSRHFSLALDQLIGVESSDPMDLTAFVNVAYKLFNAASQRSDFIMDELKAQIFLRRLIDTHHPYSWEGFQYYRKTFGFNSDIYKIMLQELSYAGEAEHWQEVFAELESKEDVDKVAWIHQLLIAYSKRANIAACKTVLESIETDFGSFPDLASWNAVLHGYVQADDMAGALAFHEHMKERGVKQDVRTSMILLRGYAARGETIKVSDQVAQIRSEGHKLTAKMIYHLVFAYLNDEDMDSAERLLYSTINTPTEDSKIEAWNAVLTSYAHQGKIADINYIHGLMHQYGLKDNGKTYAALVLGFANAQNASLAARIISDVMPMHNIVPTIHHYNILLQVLIRKGAYEFALKMYQALKKRYLKPDIVTQKLALRAVTSIHGHITKGRPGWQGVQRRALAQAEEFLRQNLEADRPEHVVSVSPLIGRDGQPIDQAFASLQFSSLLMDEGKNWTNEQMLSFFAKYKDFYKRKYPDQDIIVPVRMHTAVAEYYMSMDDFDGIVKLWHQALETLSSFAATTNADTSKPNWVLRSRCTLLGPIFRPYMIVLLKRKQYTLLDQSIKDLTQAGWRFSSSMWNTYITHLAQLGNVHLALKYCEQYLIEGFPGWPRSMTDGKTPKYEIERVSHGSLRWQKKKPNYETLVWLAYAYALWRKENAFSVQRAERMAELWQDAPKTWNAITTMPRVDDVEQNLILRDPNYRKNKLRDEDGSV